MPGRLPALFYMSPAVACIACVQTCADSSSHRVRDTSGVRFSSQAAARQHAAPAARLQQAEAQLQNATADAAHGAALLKSHMQCIEAQLQGIAGQRKPHMLLLRRVQRLEAQVQAAELAPQAHVHTAQADGQSATTAHEARDEALAALRYASCLQYARWRRAWLRILLQDLHQAVADTPNHCIAWLSCLYCRSTCAC